MLVLAEQSDHQWPELAPEQIVASDRGSVKEAIATHLAEDCNRLVVVASDSNPDAFLALVLGRLMATERLDVPVAFVSPIRTAGTRILGIPHGKRAGAIAADAAAPARSLPLVRDDTGQVLIGEGDHVFVGPGVTTADDATIYDGMTGDAVITVEPTTSEPGLRTRRARWFGGGWTAARAVQSGGESITVVRNGIRDGRSVARATFYRHHIDWKLIG
ncbi:hypothetical protein [Jongsikchunia kroppenstedtii]|uniref:hypothetical protein n=1 Tax=Jongsikchunia kroppenstedtii TaxID=1121721 RepID=UPI00036DEB9C|nr:hypothetical protein [Jongsikchunia kroppenstedtii]